MLALNRAWTGTRTALSIRRSSAKARCPMMSSGQIVERTDGGRPLVCGELFRSIRERSAALRKGSLRARPRTTAVRHPDDPRLANGAAPTALASVRLVTQIGCGDRTFSEIFPMCCPRAVSRLPRDELQALSTASSLRAQCSARARPPYVTTTFNTWCGDAAHDNHLRSSRLRRNSRHRSSRWKPITGPLGQSADSSRNIIRAGEARSRSSLAEGGSTCSPTISQYRSDRPFDQWDRRAHGTIREHPACVERAQTAARPRPDAVGDTWLELPRGRTGLSPSRAISAGTWRRPRAIRRGLGIVDDQ